MDLNKKFKIETKEDYDECINAVAIGMILQSIIKNIFTVMVLIGFV